jgi:hypothetical protein
LVHSPLTPANHCCCKACLFTRSGAALIWRNSVLRIIVIPVLVDLFTVLLCGHGSTGKKRSWIEILRALCTLADEHLTHRKVST